MSKYANSYCWSWVQWSIPTPAPQIFEIRSASIRPAPTRSELKCRWACCRLAGHTSLVVSTRLLILFYCFLWAWAGVWPAVRVQIRSISSVISWSPWHWWKRPERDQRIISRPRLTSRPWHGQDGEGKEEGGGQESESYSEDERREDGVMKASGLSRGRDMKEQVVQRGGSREAKMLHGQHSQQFFYYYYSFLSWPSSRIGLLNVKCRFVLISWNWDGERQKRRRGRRKCWWIINHMLEWDEWCM